MVIALYYGKTVIFVWEQLPMGCPSEDSIAVALPTLMQYSVNALLECESANHFPSTVIPEKFRRSQFWRDICGYIKKDSSKIVPAAAEDSSCCYHVIFPWAPPEKKVGPVDNRFYGLMSFLPKFFFTVSTKKSWVTKVLRYHRPL